MTTPALTPDLALRYLEELSTDIRAAALLDGRGELAAHGGDDDGAVFRDLVLDLLDRADEAAGGRAGEVEVSTGAGAVFAVRGRDFTVAVVTGRFVLSSLMRYDLRHVLTDLEGGAGR